MADQTKPLSAERLKLIREAFEHEPTWLDVQDIRELLDDRDHWEAEAKRYRSRCLVTAEDVEALSDESVCSWAAANGWTVVRDVQTVLSDRGSGGWWMASGGSYGLWSDENANVWGPVEFIIKALAAMLGRPAFDILDEMATVALAP